MKGYGHTFLTYDLFRFQVGTILGSRSEKGWEPLPLTFAMAGVQESCEGFHSFYYFLGAVAAITLSSVKD